jgi:hypothetical protein
MKRVATILLIFLVAFSTSAIAQTSSEEQLKQRLEELEKELAAIKAQMAAGKSGEAGQPTEAQVETPAESKQEESAISKTNMTIYGFAQLDTGYDAGATDPAWFDVIRTTKLPAFADQFGKGGNWYAGVRQSRLGVKTTTPTQFGDLKTIFEFELFGVGVDAGQTTFRLRHAWGELGQFGAGQTWSPFMDPDVFPNSLEYWGPAGMVFFRNVQLRWTPVNKNGHEFMMAIERPGASADPGAIAGRIEVANTRGRFPAPDFSTRYRYSGESGHVQLAGIVRYIQWDDLLPGDGIDTRGNAVGWGVNVSGNYKFNNKKDVARLQFVWGEGIQNYMNDSPVDVGAVLTGNPARPFDGRPLTQVGVVAFLDHNWSDRWSTSVGYSLNDVENTFLQAPSAFSQGHYGIFNLLFYPVKNVMAGAEFQWGRRKNHRDGWIYDDYRVQLGARYNFSFDLFGDKGGS